jgi:putative membrane protein
MALLSEAQMQQVARAITEVERKTDAELVTVLAPRSDNYLYIPTLIAAVLALLSPLVLQWLPPWLSPGEILVLQWLVFVVLALLFRIPIILRWLIPPRVKSYRAEIMARRQFLENNLHHTQK